MVVRDQLLHNVGAGAGDDAVFKIRRVHIDDAAVGVAQIVHQGGIGFAGGDGQYLTVGGHVHDLRVAGGAVVVFQQVIQALLYGFAVHVPAGGEFHAIPEGDRPDAAAVVCPVGGQPGFQLHGVGVMHQGFSDAVADAGPAVVGAVGVNGFFPVFGVEGGVADDHGFLGCRLRRAGTAAAGQQSSCQTGGQQERNNLSHDGFLS